MCQLSSNQIDPALLSQADGTVKDSLGMLDSVSSSYSIVGAISAPARDDQGHHSMTITEPSFEATSRLQDLFKSAISGKPVQEVKVRLKAGRDDRVKSFLALLDTGALNTSCVMTHVLKALNIQPCLSDPLSAATLAGSVEFSGTAELEYYFDCIPDIRFLSKLHVLEAPSNVRGAVMIFELLLGSDWLEQVSPFP